MSAKMANIIVNGKTISCPTGANLYRTLRDGGMHVSAPCGGSGICGKCIVTVTGVGPVKACQYTVTQDIEVTLPAARAKIAVEGLLRPVKADHLAPSVAVDIGTTTVAAYLLADGKIIDAESALNCQKPYGDDVLSRIKYTTENADGLKELSLRIQAQVREMTDTLCARNGLRAEQTAIAGNTVMLHLYAGVSPASIGVAPFTPVFTQQKTLGATVLLPSIAGYVGADTVAAILASGMHRSQEMCLLADIGTNGEIALGNRDGITVCAAAAGPAFEGAQIRCGVGGVSGAVSSVRLAEGTVSYTTIDDEPPIGICGSGILDAVAEMLCAGLVDESGFFEDEVFPIAEGVFLTAEDIRQVQLAKAAIAAGIQTLLSEAQVPLSDIKTCWLAGGFGSYLNKNSACAIGLLPKELLEQIRPLGNAAGMGAALWLLSDECRKETQEIVRMTRYLELSGNPVFNHQFLSCMGFTE